MKPSSLGLVVGCLAWLLLACDDLGLADGPPDGTGGASGGSGGNPQVTGGQAGLGGCTHEERPIDECPCEPMQEDVCDQFDGVVVSFAEGCGYLYYRWEGDVGDQGATIYDLETREVVYYFAEQTRDWEESQDCFYVSYGEIPDCEWEPSALCPGPGGAGGGPEG